MTHKTKKKPDGTIRNTRTGHNWDTVIRIAAKKAQKVNAAEKIRPSKRKKGKKKKESEVLLPTLLG